MSLLRPFMLALVLACALSSPTAAQAADLSVSDATVTEGNSGTTDAVFEVTLASSAPR
ncbi:MAG: hypothetical protein M3350_10300 [Actinomycetota bacterium]|nr:hypothetical protein [Actinomycetota bacterium]MDQ3721150.1 hypothetical protein [Actinomycetota bacterium]